MLRIIEPTSGRCLLLPLFAFIALLSPVAQATIVTWEMDANITSVSGSVPGGISVGDLAAVTIRYDTGAALFSDDGYPNPSAPDVHVYGFGSPVVSGSALFSVEVNSTTWYGTGDDLEVLVADIASGDSIGFIGDGVQTTPPPNLPSSCCGGSGPYLQLSGSDTFLTSDQIPINPSDIDLTQLTQGFGGLSSADGYSFEFSVDTSSVVVNAIPEPSLVALFGIGLAGFGFRVRKQIKAALGC